jgi:hypothetical protein
MKPMHREGYILILAVGMIAIMSITAMRMITDWMSFQQIESVLFAREQAKQYAWSGIQIAMSQITEQLPKPEDKKISESELIFKKQLFELRKVMTITSRWQTITFNDEHDGMAGSCTIYIACEQGKLNPFALAQMALSEKNAEQSQKKSLQQSNAAPSRSPVQVIRQELQRVLAQRGITVDVLGRLMSFFEKRNNESLDDVTELLTDEQLKPLNEVLFLSPDRDWALMDFFSIQHTSKVLQAWALSVSVAALDRLKAIGKPNEEDMKKIGDTVQQQRQAKETWDLVLQSLYHKQISPEWYNLLNTRFEADIFSVISYGTYRDVMVKLYAIVQRIKVKKQDGTELDECVTKKIYWIYD